jgi:2C-methyl-D-erythritol 2,4-cyclodiphosphate synthase
MSNYEHCIECEDLTGRAGASEDSLFHGYSGPFCEDCFDEWPDNQVAEITLLKARAAELEIENKRLRAANVDCIVLEKACKAELELSHALAAEIATALRDASDIIQTDANTAENYGSLCRIGNVLSKVEDSATMRAEDLPVDHPRYCRPFR